MLPTKLIHSLSLEIVRGRSLTSLPVRTARTAALFRLYGDASHTNSAHNLRVTRLDLPKRGNRRVLACM